MKIQPLFHQGPTHSQGNSRTENEQSFYQATSLILSILLALAEVEWLTWNSQNRSANLSRDITLAKNGKQAFYQATSLILSILLALAEVEWLTWNSQNRSANLSRDITLAKNGTSISHDLFQ